MIGRCSCRVALGAVVSRSSLSGRGSAMATRREATGSLTIRLTAATVTRVFSCPSARDSIVLPLSRCDSCRLSHCDDFSLAVRDYDDGRLPPRSFLRDKPSWRFASLRNHRCACTRRPDAISVYQNCRARPDNRNHREIGRASRPVLAAVFSSFLLASVTLAVEAREPAPRTLLPPVAGALAPALA